MPIPSGYAQTNIQFTGTAAPQGAEVTIAWDLTGFTGNAEDIAVGVGNAWRDEVMPFLTNAVTLSGVLAKIGPDATGPSHLEGYNTAGSSSSANASPQVCYLVHKNTAQGGRAGRGRMYLPGVGEDKVSAAGAIDSSFITSLNAALGDFLIQAAFTVTPPVLLHGVGSPLTTPTEITSLTTDGTAATQRRRLR